jgi:hypothetical protein
MATKKRTSIDELIADWLQDNNLRGDDSLGLAELDDLAKRIHDYKDKESQATIIRQQKELEKCKQRN